MSALEKYRKKVSGQYGTDFAFIFNFAQQAILKSQHNQGKSRGVWYWNLEIEQDLWKGADLFVEFEVDRGKGVDKFLPTYSIYNDNSGEDAWFYLPALYLEQRLLGDKLFLAAGKLDMSYWFDCNEAANSADTQFFSSSLVNSLTIPFPANGIGALATFSPDEWVYLQFGAATARASYTRVGLSDAFNSAFFIAEAGLAPRFFSLPGNYRFIFHSNHEKLGYVDSADEEETKKNDFGWALGFDQAITRQVTLFARYGAADPKVRDIEHFWSCGAQVVEPIPGRKFDLLAFGVAQSIMGDEYLRANGEDAARAETMYEIYYSLGFNNAVSLTPDIQIVTNPNADKTAETEIVFGLRFLLSF